MAAANPAPTNSPQQEIQRVVRAYDLCLPNDYYYRGQHRTELVDAMDLQRPRVTPGYTDTAHLRKLPVQRSLCALNSYWRTTLLLPTLLYSFHVLLCTAVVRLHIYIN